MIENVTYPQTQLLVHKYASTQVRIKYTDHDDSWIAEHILGILTGSVSSNGFKQYK